MQTLGEVANVLLARGFTSSSHITHAPRRTDGFDGCDECVAWADKASNMAGKATK